MKWKVGDDAVLRDSHFSHVPLRVRVEALEPSTTRARVSLREPPRKPFVTGDLVWVDVDRLGTSLSSPGDLLDMKTGAAIVDAGRTPLIRTTEVKPGDWLKSLTSAERKECAVHRGLFGYFPDACALVARHSVRANEKHNPGQPVHWSREKSKDHDDCIARHTVAIAANPDALDDGQPEVVCRAWRAFAALQIWVEGKLARGEKV